MACVRRVSAHLGAFGSRDKQRYAEIGSRHRKVDIEVEMPAGRIADVDVQRSDGRPSSGETGRVSHRDIDIQTRIGLQRDRDRYRQT